MAPTSTTQAPPTAAAYGFHCEIADTVFAADGRVGVAFMDPVAVLQMTGNPEVARVAHEVRGRLERVRAALVQGAGGAGE